MTAFLGTTTIPSRMTQFGPSASWARCWLTMRTFLPMRAFRSMIAPSITLPDPTPTGGEPGGPGGGKSSAPMISDRRTVALRITVRIPMIDCSTVEFSMSAPPASNA